MYSHFVNKNIRVYARFHDQSFNDTLTNDIVSFEQLGPDYESLFGPAVFQLVGFFSSDCQYLKCLPRVLILQVSSTLKGKNLLPEPFHHKYYSYVCYVHA